MEPFIGQIMGFGGNFAPRGWAFCDGQLLPISSNSALFSILGTIYGGDGRTTFALPDLRGRVAIQHGNGPGLQNYPQGSKGGAETHTLTVAEIPSHNHTMNAEGIAANSNNARNNLLALAQQPIFAQPDPQQEFTMANESIGNTGGGNAFNIRDPYLAISWIIALQGTFPSRS